MEVIPEKANAKKNLSIERKLVNLENMKRQSVDREVPRVES